MEGRKPYRGPVPKRFIQGLDRYADQHIRTGDFLYAVLTNNLKEAVAHADDDAQVHLVEIVRYMFNEMPCICQGSIEKVEAWILAGLTEREKINKVISGIEKAHKATDKSKLIFKKEVPQLQYPMLEMLPRFKANEENRLIAEKMLKGRRVVALWDSGNRCWRQNSKGECIVVKEVTGWAGYRWPFVILDCTREDKEPVTISTSGRFLLSALNSSEILLEGEEETVPPRHCAEVELALIKETSDGSSNNL